MKGDIRHRRDLVHFGRLLHEHGYVAATDGNLSAVTYGENLLRAYMKMELLEHFARISLVAKLLGHERLLTAKEVEDLDMARQKYQLADVRRA